MLEIVSSQRKVVQSSPLTWLLLARGMDANGNG
jgi:hypothetical protein